METEEKTINSESVEDTKASDNVEIPRQVHVDLGNTCSSPNRLPDSKLPEKVIKGTLISSDDMNVSDIPNEEEICSDDDAETGDIADKAKPAADVCYSFGTDDAHDAVGNKTDAHTAINDEVEEKDGDNSVEILFETVNKDINSKPCKCDYAEADKYNDSIKTTAMRHKPLLNDDSESCDLPNSEINVLVEESVSSLPVNSDNTISDMTNDQDADTIKEKLPKSLAEENVNINIPLLNAQELAIDSQDANQKKEHSCPSLDHSSAVHLPNKDKTNSDSDMDIDNDVDSDPEFLSSKLPNESDPNGSALSFMDYPVQATEAPKYECEAQINDLVSGMVLAPDDVIIECKDKRNFFYCNVCHCNIHHSIRNVKEHKKGKSHKAAMIKYKKSVVMSMKNTNSLDKSGSSFMFLDCYIERYKPQGYYCRLCNFIAEKIKVMDDHVHGKWHETTIHIMKAGEITAQQKDGAEKGTKDEMKELDEEFNKILESERLKSWNSHSAAIAEDVSKNETTVDMELYYNMQDPSLYSGTQDSFPQNQYYQNFMHKMNPDTSNAPCTQKNPVSDASELQQTKVPTPSQPEVKNSSLDVPFSITKDSDSEIVVEVIDSLLQTYLKYKLKGLPESLVKLPHNLKTEERISHLNRFATNRTGEKSFHNLQNSKNKYQSAFPPNDARPLPDMYRGVSNEYVENRSWKRTHANEDKPNNSNNYLCPEDQMRKQITPRSIDIMRRSEDNFSRNLKETESIIDELHHYRSSYKGDDPTKRMRQSKPFANDTYRRFKNYGEEDVSHLTGQNESADYNLLKQYNSARSIKQFEPHSADFSNVYIRGSNIEDRYSTKPHQNTQSMAHLMKTFRNSSSFGHY